MTKNKKWTKKEIDFLKENYLKLEFNEIGRTLNRSYSAIAHKASRLGFKKGYQKSEIAKKRMSETRLRKIKRGDKDIKIFQKGELNIIHNPIIKEKARQGIIKYNKDENVRKDKSDNMKRLYKEGLLKPNYKCFKKGHLSHCKGKTKENYEPLRRIAERVSKTKKRLFKEGKLKPTIEKGQTLEDRYGFEKAQKIKEKQSITRKRLIKEGKIKNYTPVENSSIEVKIQNFLKELGIEFFTHQHMKIEHRYPCDILIPSMNLVIECDGDYWHKYPIGNDIDHIRTSELIKKGFKVLRLWECEIIPMNLNDFRKLLKEK